MTVNIPYINKNVLIANEAGDWFQTEFDVKEILAQFVGIQQIPFVIQAPTNNEPYIILPNTRCPLTVKSVVLWTKAGTLTGNLKIGSTNITSLDAIAVTSTRATTTATGANLMIVNNDLVFTPSNILGVDWIYGNVWCDRTGAGSA